MSHHYGHRHVIDPVFGRVGLESDPVFANGLYYESATIRCFFRERHLWREKGKERKVEEEEEEEEIEKLKNSRYLYERNYFVHFLKGENNKHAHIFPKGEDPKRKGDDFLSSFYSFPFGVTNAVCFSEARALLGHGASGL